MTYNFKHLLYKNPSFIKLKNRSLYMAIYQALKEAINNKELPNHFKLPPSRVLATDLGVSRSTIIKAYELLTMEHLLISKQGSGYYIHGGQTNADRQSPAHFIQEASDKLPEISRFGAAFLKHSPFNQEDKVQDSTCFRPGLPPLDLFPTHHWQKLSSAYWKSAGYAALSYDDSLGTLSLRTNIAHYLKIYRNIHCDAKQIVVTSGSLHSLSLISMCLVDQGDSVIVENPTYKKAYSLFKSLHLNILTADLTETSFDWKSIPLKRSKLCYVIPSNRYPSGNRMTLGRRHELLNFAVRKGLIIVEDDYDHEFSNWEDPIPSIFSQDKHNRVVYLGTFNKLMHPSLRLGYMIVPEFLLDTVAAISKQTFRFISPSLQNVMAEFIAKDYLNRHLRKVMRTAKERKSFFIQYFESLFKTHITLEVNNDGLHVIGILNKDIQDDLFCAFLKQHNIHIFPLSSYYVGSERRNGLVMGYCSVNKTQIKEKLDRMFILYKRYIGQ